MKKIFVTLCYVTTLCAPNTLCMGPCDDTIRTHLTLEETKEAEAIYIDGEPLISFPVEKLGNRWSLNKEATIAKARLIIADAMKARRYLTRPLALSQPAAL